jgi:hypothetical protein
MSSQVEHTQVHLHSTVSFAELKYAPQHSMIIVDSIKELTEFSRTSIIGTILKISAGDEMLIRATVQARIVGEELDYNDIL